MTKHITIHTITPMGVNCANRDDMGDVKTAIIGGVTRQRRSSQNIKRAIRTYMAEQGISIGYRGRKQHEKLSEVLVRVHGWAKEDADVASLIWVVSLAKNLKEASKVSEAAANDPNTSSIVANAEIEAWAEVLNAEIPATGHTPAADAVVGGKTGYFPFLGQNGISKKFLDKIKAALATKKSGITPDIALFGRMMASATDLDIAAASSFAHSISTHASSNQQDFYVCKGDDEDTSGSDMMGHQSFAASVMYGCCHLDLDLLAKNLSHLSVGERQDIVAAFVEGAILTHSGARKNGMAANQLPAYVRVVVSTGATLEADFTTPVTGNILGGSTGRLRWCLEQVTKFIGPKRAGIISDTEYEAGVSENVTLDSIIAKVVADVV